MRSAASGKAEALEQLGGPVAKLAATEAVDPSSERQVLAPGGLDVDRDALPDRADQTPHLLWLGENVEPGDRGGRRRRAARGW